MSDEEWRKALIIMGNVILGEKLKLLLRKDAKWRILSLDDSVWVLSMVSGGSLDLSHFVVLFPQLIVNQQLQLCAIDVPSVV